MPEKTSAWSSPPSITKARPSIAAYGNPGPTRKPLDADSVFEIGSITKVFTAILLADMADRGEVALDDPVAQSSARRRAGT